MKAVALILGLLGTPLAAQSVIPQGTGDAPLRAALAQPGLIIDGISTWPVDWDGVPPTDLLVQTVYASAAGGNASGLEYRIVTPTPTGPTLGDTFVLPGNGIKEVQTHPQGALLIQYLYRDGDPRCCPSGLISTILSRGTP
ncbi:hypothetical protein [Tateyamaria sp. SN6-1]|uniref:hypothetical protein n=1 Tax=Tateyamaria sp. SN6-1 TaxID=3092148 RepID=UPI0039F5296C